MSMTFPAILVRCFDLQRELMVRYQQIEQFPTPPLALHTTSDQRVLKDFAWRFTEELGESYDATLKGETLERAGEEFADAMHFFIELCIFAGITSMQCLARCADLPTTRMTQRASSDDLEGAYWRVIYDLAMAMNCLRNRPWKQTNATTDEGRFRTKLLDVYSSLVVLWATLGFTQDEVYAFFIAKHNANKTRQEEKY